MIIYPQSVQAIQISLKPDRNNANGLTGIKNTFMWSVSLFSIWADYTRVIKWAPQIKF